MFQEMLSKRVQMDMIGLKRVKEFLNELIMDYELCLLINFLVSELSRSKLFEMRKTCLEDKAAVVVRIPVEAPHLSFSTISNTIIDHINKHSNFFLADMFCFSKNGNCRFNITWEK